MRTQAGSERRRRRWCPSKRRADTLRARWRRSLGSRQPLGHGVARGAHALCDHRSRCRPHERMEPFGACWRLFGAGRGLRRSHVRGGCVPLLASRPQRCGADRHRACRVVAAARAFERRAQHLAEQERATRATAGAFHVASVYRARALRSRVPARMPGHARSSEKQESRKT
jgi:hypothetical protein